MPSAEHNSQPVRRRSFLFHVGAGLHAAALMSLLGAICTQPKSRPTTSCRRSPIVRRAPSRSFTCS